MGFWTSLFGQLRSMPYPQEDCTDKVIIVTGGNGGLGQEAARHFVRLNAAKVILGCRSVEKAEETKRDIEETTKRTDVVETWPLDLSSFESVKEFAARANKLERLDILLNNASVLNVTFKLEDGHESHMTVNVISTLLLSLLVLPALRRTGVKFNITPHVSTVSSDAAYLIKVAEPTKENAIEAMDDPKSNITERYSITKLLQLFIIQKLAEAADASGKGHVIVNAVNPGFCSTQLFRRAPSIVAFFMNIIAWAVARTPEMGSRTLMTAVFAGEDTHGNWMSNCELHDLPTSMKGEAGEKLVDRYWEDLLEVVEGIEPGVTQNL